MKRIVICLIFSLAVSACGKDAREVIFRGTALGVPEKTVVVESTAGQVHLDVISNEEYTIVTRSSWLSLPAVSRDREGITAVYEANEGALRTAEIFLAIGDTHKDTLYLTQRGKYAPILSFVSPSLMLDGATPGSKRIGVQTNLSLDQIKMYSSFPEGTAPWLSDISFTGNALSFRYEANPSEESLRSAQICFTYRNEEGVEVQTNLYVSQKTRSNTEGIPISWADFRTEAATERTVFTEDKVLEGIIVSNKASGNMGNPVQTSVIGIDYTLADRTVYLQSADGQYGVRILCQRSEDNIFSQFDRVHLSLKGLSAYKENVAGADYYCIDGFSAYHILSCESGAAVVKTKKISELTDEDLFTYVSLTDVELPIRKGPLTPVNEKFTNASGVNKVSKFPIVVRDKDGRSLYLYTNMTCIYRRDGHRLPGGSGTLSGVLVSELYSRFAWADNPSGDEDLFGNIGKYQLRHTSLDDFALSSDIQESGISVILAEWRYLTSSNQIQYFATDGDKTAWFGHSSSNSITLYDDFSYLGPVGTKNGVYGAHPENINGLGVILSDGTDWMAPGYTGPNSSYLSKVNNTSAGAGCGISPSNIGAAWYTNINYTSGTRTPQGLILHFSTAGVHTSLSLQLCMMTVKLSSNATTGPRDFRLAWSLDGESWEDFASFRLPDYSPASPITQLWQTAGYMPMTFQLPDAVKEQAQVQVRIFPDEASVLGDDLHYVTVTEPANTVPRTAFNYIGIRYNK